MTALTTRTSDPRAVFGTVLVAVFVSNLDLFVVNVALPDIGRDFDGASLDALSWVLNAYAIVFAALLVVCGRLADRSGHRRGFMLGLTVFTVGSLLCAAAPGVAFLVAARVIQALGAAALLPTSLALLLAATPVARRTAVVRAWSAVGGIAAALGPVVGGLLVEVNWRWVFVINVPVGVLALLVSPRVLPDVRSTEPGRAPDLPGAVLLTVAVGVLSLALVRADDWGWTSWRVIGSVIATLVLVRWFLARSARHPAPVVELPLLRIPTFGAAVVAALLFTVAFAALLLASALWVQDVWGYSALRTGLALAPGPLMVPAVAVGAGPLIRRIGAGPVTAVGIALLGAGVLSLALRLEATPDYAADFLPGLIVVGFGVGLALPTVVAVATAALPEERLATGSGIVTMGRQLGAVLGVAVLVSVLGSPRTPAAALDAFGRGWMFIAGTCVLGAAAALLIRGGRH
ncbi:MFS transporter [Virgisporangium aliadipatigenens]|uniref:MFS transporter n=1 Tax=Virgisporangium aliadipatigenens TaxID=741659 RepID=A0A8J4DTG7_9ACTN|nr:MFS transporter [Virgisporangium aliadipatigenens]GIJ48222.1 MFS transporter [Virgisporangium aliadipatigenens]